MGQALSARSKPPSKANGKWLRRRNPLSDALDMAAKTQPQQPQESPLVQRARPPRPCTRRSLLRPAPSLRPCGGQDVHCSRRVHACRIFPPFPDRAQAQHGAPAHQRLDHLHSAIDAIATSRPTHRRAAGPKALCGLVLGICVVIVPTPWLLRRRRTITATIWLVGGV